MKKILIFVILAVSLIFALSSCDNSKKDEETYTVRFDANGAEKPKRQTVDRGDEAVEPDTPTKIGYVFVGWFYNEEEWDFSNPVKKNMTLVAKWERCEDHKDENEDLLCDKCSEEFLVLYEELGLKFYLPNEFRKYASSVADIYYKTSDATFEVQYMPKEEFDDVEMGYVIPFNMTVKEYTDFLISENGWTDPDKTEQYTYDEKRDSTSFTTFWTPDPEEYPWEYYYVTVMKNEKAFYVVFFICDEYKYMDYSDMFESLSERLSIEK